MTFAEDMRQFNTLVNIIAKLRAPDGCPWDRKQTHRSLRENLLEETYEVLDALDKEDPGKLREELGDLLMQIVLHSQLAAEQGEFQLKDVINSINEKLVHRHPHIFGTQKVADAEEVAHNWEVLKQEERAEGVSMLASVPWQMPALAYSQEIQRRVAQVGFDWENIEGVVDKLVEEVNEFKQAEGQEQKEKEFGDLLFTLVNFARRLGIDSEAALRETNRRFFERFTFMERACLERGIIFAGLSFAEQNALWEEAKKTVGG